MFKFLVFLLLLITLTFGRWPLSVESGGVNGGTNCVVCTLLVAVISQTSELYQESPKAAMERLCGYFGDENIIRDACIGFRDTFGDLVAFYLDQGLSPDDTCYKLELCTMETGQLCRLFPGPSSSLSSLSSLPAHIKHLEEPSFCDVPGIKEICDLMNRWGNDHLPVDDLDNDSFSTIDSMRGTMWRGKDCNDLDSDIHPGRVPFLSDRNVDSNCNGIYGIDNATNKPYEDLFCKNTTPMGVAVLGDSAGAHFHIPPEWLNVTAMNEKVFDQVYFVLLDELDWPMLSATTGYFNNTNNWEYIIDGPVDSIYLRMLERNRCNHRDYSNMGVNGARSGAMASGLDQQVRRNPSTDYPLLLVYELIGNDVCSGHPTMDTMTTPEEFYNNNLEVFQYLDSHLPNGSKILAMGLANGTVLYENMHDLIHPIGWLNQDVTYTNVYDYLNCLQVSPCFGWMNSNATWRQQTQQRADELSATLQQLVNTVKFENITIEYIDCPINQMISEWIQSGGEAWELIEPVDGFHPNQQANALMAEIIWNNLLNSNYSYWIPPYNPYNSQITKIFGNQNGY